jgi:hypothetical protein
MSNAPPRVAIVLQGPPVVGKSAIRDELLLRLRPEARFINLDAYWGQGEWRYAEEAFRYADIQLAPEPVLVMELTSGEPPGLDRPGAVRGAQEWMNVLQQTGRRAFVFRLSLAWHQYIQRLHARLHGHPQILFAITNQAGLYALY